MSKIQIRGIICSYFFKKVFIKCVPFCFITSLHDVTDVVFVDVVMFGFDDVIVVVVVIVVVIHVVWVEDDAVDVKEGFARRRRFHVGGILVVVEVSQLGLMP